MVSNTDKGGCYVDEKTGADGKPLILLKLLLKNCIKRALLGAREIVQQT